MICSIHTALANVYIVREVPFYSCSFYLAISHIFIHTCKTFIRLKRKHDEETDKYTDEFEESYATLMKVGGDLDDETLSLQLVESAEFTDELS